MKKWSKTKMDIAFYGVFLIVIFCVGVLLYTYGFHSGCDDCYEVTGYFNRVKDDFHIVLDNDSWYVSDWYIPGGSMPLGIDKYVNHTVWFRYAASCGRCMILDMKIKDNH